MCGFLGRIALDSCAQPEGSDFTAAVRSVPSLQRRGPDASSYWQSSDGRVSLFHTRLTIVDASASAHQPFSDLRRELTIAFNGEIYNYADLRHQLTDYPFRTHSDT